MTGRFSADELQSLHSLLDRLCDWPGPMLDLSATLDDADLRQ